MHNLCVLTIKNTALIFNRKLGMGVAIFVIIDIMQNSKLRINRFIYCIM